LASLSFDGNFPTEEARVRLLREHFFQRAVQVYLGALPAVNMLPIRDASEAMWGRGYNILPIWKRRMDARCRVPTPNADVIYAMSYLSLAADGPLVVEAPPGILGMLSDFWQRSLSDVGFAGPDRGQGGQLPVDPSALRRSAAAGRLLHVAVTDEQRVPVRPGVPRAGC
jgi:hypothetical protein